MGYKIFDAKGELVGGDDVLDEAVKGAALLVNGWVEDADGVLAYDSPGHIEAMRRAEEPPTPPVLDE